MNRDRKWRTFLDVIAPDDRTTILDVGFNATEYSAVDNYLEKHHPHPANITALGLDDPSDFRARYPDVDAIQYGGGRFPFDDDQFDVCWSNAVIEHVGERAAQVEFVREVRRVAKRAFITTPNRYFPIEVHTRTPLLHWLPKPVFDRALRARGIDWATGDYMHLLTRRQFELILHEAGVEKPTIIRNRLAGPTLDFIASF